MHILLIDRLICPRCGPGFGLILIADLLENRRVIEGSLGCPNCRDRFPVEGGFGDLRPPPRTAERGADVAPLAPPASPPAVEVAALLGLAEGAGSVALIGDLAGHATELAGLVPGVEFVGIAEGLRGWEEGEGVSRITARGCLPFGSGTLRGVGFDAAGGPVAAGEPPLVAELARVIAPTGRIAVWGSVGEWERAFRSVGLEVLAQEESALVVAPTDR